MAIFPTEEWVQAFVDKLNTDEQYAEVAQKWEGDFYFIIEPDSGLIYGTANAGMVTW